MGRKIRRRTGLPGRAGCGLRGASGGMASAWLVMTILVAHVASVNAVFKPTTKGELDLRHTSCLTNVASGVQCCAASPYCNSGAGTATFTDDIGDWDTSLITDMSSLFVMNFNADIGLGTSQVRHEPCLRCLSSTKTSVRGHLAGHGHGDMFLAPAFNKTSVVEYLAGDDHGVMFSAPRRSTKTSDRGIPRRSRDMGACSMAPPRSTKTSDRGIPRRSRT